MIPDQSTSVGKMPPLIHPGQSHDNSEHKASAERAHGSHRVKSVEDRSRCQGECHGTMAAGKGFAGTGPGRVRYGPELLGTAEDRDIRRSRPTPLVLEDAVDHEPGA